MIKVAKCTDTQSLRPFRLSIKPEQFSIHLVYLHEQGLRPFMISIIRRHVGVLIYQAALGEVCTL